ncbi:MAG: transporter [Calditrichia bacterium]
MFIRIIAIITCLILSLSAQMTSHHHTIAHAPIGVMAAHTHHAGAVMLSYRYMYMGMTGSLDGSESLEDASIVDPNGSNFIVTPTKMPMQMHMLGAMYAPIENLTLILMLPVLSNEMDHLTRSGATFTTASSGLGDVSLSGMIVLRRFGNQQIHVTAGASFPTGSLEAKDVTPASAPNESLLPYPMQLGSGTIDLKPGLTYLGQQNTLSWGAQISGAFRLGENSEDYTLGNRLEFTSWGAKMFTSSFSGSVRIAYSAWGDIDGANAAFAGAVTNRFVPTVFTDLRGGKRLDGGLGVNFSFSGALSGLRFAVEGLLPVYQSLDGPQLETDFTLTSGLQYAF